MWTTTAAHTFLAINGQLDKKMPILRPSKKQGGTQLAIKLTCHCCCCWGRLGVWGWLEASRQFSMPYVRSNWGLSRGESEGGALGGADPQSGRDPSCMKSWREAHENNPSWWWWRQPFWHVMNSIVMTTNYLKCWLEYSRMPFCIYHFL